MKYPLLLVAFVLQFLVISNQCNAQLPWQWGRSNSVVGGLPATSGTIGRPIVTDRFGNVYTSSGVFWTPSSTYGSHVVPNTGLFKQLVISKLDSSGNYLWAVGTQNSDVYPYGMATDSVGNLYVAARYENTTCLIDTTNIYGPARTCFLVKFSPAGSVLWTRNIYSTDHFVGVTSDGLGGLYVSGRFWGTLIIDADTLHAGAVYANFMAKFDTNGVLVWLKKTTPNPSDVRSLATTKSGYSYIFGTYGGDSLVLGTFHLINSHSWVNGHEQGANYLAKFDSGGNVVWAKNLNPYYSCSYRNLPDAVFDNCLATDAQDNVYLTGAGDTTVLIGGDTIGHYGFVIKYDSSGNFSRVYTSKASAAVDAVAVDAYQNVWFSGAMNTARPADSGKTVRINGHTLYEPLGSIDPVYIIGFDASGNYLNSSVLPSGGSNYHYQGIATGENSSLYFTTYYRQDVCFGPDTLHGPPIATLTLVGKAQYNPKYQPPVTTSISTVSTQEFNIYPNPADDELAISITTSFSVGKAEIYDISGRLMISHLFTGPDVLLSTKEVASGLYLCRITLDDNVQTCKVVVSH